MPWSYLAGLISLAFLHVSSAIGLSAVFVRLMSQMFKREDSGETSSHDFVDRHNVFELRKKYFKPFCVFGVLAVICFVSYNVLGIWTNGDPEVEAHLRRTVSGVVIAVFLTAVVIVWRKIGGFRGWNARMARRNEIIQKELWADDPNPAVPTDFDNVFQNPYKQNGLVFYLPLSGLACCVVSFICMVRSIGGWTPPIVFVGGWVIGVTGTYLCARKARKGWLLADARCIKQMIKRVATSGAGGSSGFSAIIVCEYEYAGVKYRVTPKITAVAIVSFPTAGTVERYLRKKIAPDGTCKLHFNPGNPLQTTLYGGGWLEVPRESTSTIKIHKSSLKTKAGLSAELTSGYTDLQIIPFGKIYKRPRPLWNYPGSSKHPDLALMGV